MDNDKRKFYYKAVVQSFVTGRSAEKKVIKATKNTVKEAFRLTYKPCVNTLVTMKEGLFISSFMTTPLFIQLYDLFRWSLIKSVCMCLCVFYLWL